MITPKKGGKAQGLPKNKSEGFHPRNPQTFPLFPLIRPKRHREDHHKVQCDICHSKGTLKKRGLEAESRRKSTGSQMIRRLTSYRFLLYCPLSQLSSPLPGSRLSKEAVLCAVITRPSVSHC